MPRRTAVALILEDQPFIALDLETTLGDAGFDVAYLASCEEAHAWLDVCKPDVVIVDIELSDGPSDQVVERLIEGNIPFIVHSGDPEGLHLDTPFAQGRWLRKPAVPEELVKVAQAMTNPAERWF